MNSQERLILEVISNNVDENNQITYFELCNILGIELSENDKDYTIELTALGEEYTKAMSDMESVEIN